MSVFPVILAGRKVDADLLTSMLPLTEWKTADESRTSNSVLLDNQLFVTLPAAGVYIFECHVILESNTAGADWQGTLGGGTASGTIYWSGKGPHNSMTTGSQADGEWIARVASGTATPYAASQTAGTHVGVLMTGLFDCSTGGTFGLRWGQQTTNGTPTVVNTGSHLKVHRIA